MTRLIPSLSTSSLRRSATLALSLLLGASLLPACGGDDDDDTGGDVVEFVGKNYTLSVVGVEDGCQEGALNALFLPEGEGSESAFDKPIYVPGADELPWADKTITLPSPFDEVVVTITGTAETRLITGADNKNVLIDDENQPGCRVDFDTSVSMNIADPARLTGTATLSMSNLSNTDTCFEVTSDPCSISLDLTGVPSGS